MLPFRIVKSLAPPRLFSCLNKKSEIFLFKSVNLNISYSFSNSQTFINQNITNSSISELKLLIQQGNVNKQSKETITQSHHQLALLYSEEGNFEESINHAKIAIESNSNILSDELVKIFVDSKKSDTLITILEQIQSANQDGNCSYWLGRVHSLSGNDRKSIEWYHKAIEASEDKKHSLANMQIGIFLKRIGDLETSTCYLYTSVQDDPSNYTARITLGNNLRILGESFVGREHLEECLKLDASNPQPYFDLALCFEQSGDLEECKRYLRLNIEKNNTFHQESYLRLANILIASGAESEGLELLLLGINQSRSFEPIQSFSSLLKKVQIPKRLEEDSLKLEEKRLLEETIDEFRVIYSLENKECWEVFNLLTQLFLIHKRIDLAIVSEKTLANLQINEVQHRLNIATLYRNHSQLNEAINEYKKLISLKENESHFWYFLGQVQLQAGDIQGAISSYERSLEIQNANDYCLYELAFCHELNGNTVLQEQQLKTLLGYFPQFLEEEKDHIQFIKSIAKQGKNTCQ